MAGKKRKLLEILRKHDNSTIKGAEGKMGEWARDVKTLLDGPLHTDHNWQGRKF